MNNFNVVELINDNEILKKKGILKGYSGVLINSIAGSNKCTVMFFNPRDIGDYAVAAISKSDLKPLGRIPDETVFTYREIASRPDFYEHTELRQTRLKMYDRVELSKDKVEYEREGLKKGLQGCVMSEYAVKGKWQVIFTEPDSGKDIDKIVAESDLTRVD